MCGRYTLRTPPGELITDFGLYEEPDFKPRYNISPSQVFPIIQVNKETSTREGTLLRWGLVPFWAEDPKISYKTINAKVETAAKSPAYRAAFKYRRCLVPADGFYKWKKTGKAKQPMFIQRKDDRPVAFAGLWEHWEKDQGEPLETYSILTGEPNDLLRPIHNRMSVILKPEDYDQWRNPELQDPKTVQGRLKPYPLMDLTVDSISTRINNPRNEDPRCIQLIS